MYNKFSGLLTAVVTPFKQDKSVDFDSFEKLIEEQIHHNVDGLVILGTTGESTAINSREYNQIIKLAIEKSARKAKIIVGTGGSNVESTIKKTQIARDLGADGVLVVTPCYNRPTQKGLHQYFTKIANEVNIPMLLYNVPARTGVTLETDTLANLSRHINIVGIKEASANILKIVDIINVTDPDFTVLSGDDISCYSTMSLGAHGIVSVISNVFIKEMRSLVWQLLHNHFDAAKNSYYKLYPIIKALSGFASNPIPIKTLMAYQKKIKEEFRLPLTTMDAKDRQKLIDIYTQYINE